MGAIRNPRLQRSQLLPPHFRDPRGATRASPHAAASLDAPKTGIPTPTQHVNVLPGRGPEAVRNSQPWRDPRSGPLKSEAVLLSRLFFARFLPCVFASIYGRFGPVIDLPRISISQDTKRGFHPRADAPPRLVKMVRFATFSAESAAAASVQRRACYRILRVLIMTIRHGRFPSGGGDLLLDSGAECAYPRSCVASGLGPIP